MQDAGSRHQDFLADHAIEDPYDGQNLGPWLMTRALQKRYAEWIQNRIIHSSWKSGWSPDALFRHIHDLLVKNSHCFFAQTCHWCICFNDPPLAKSMRMSLVGSNCSCVGFDVCVGFAWLHFFQQRLIVRRCLVTNSKLRASLGPSNCGISAVCLETVQRYPNLSLERSTQLSDQWGRWVFPTKIYLRNPSWDAGNHALVM